MVNKKIKTKWEIVIMKFEFLFVLLVFFTSLLLEFNAFAQQGTTQSRNVKKQVIDFEDQLVEGEVSRSELMLLLQKKQYNLGRLIELREDFLPEMRRAKSDVK